MTLPIGNFIQKNNCPYSGNDSCPYSGNDGCPYSGNDKQNHLLLHNTPPNFGGSGFNQAQIYNP
jgi:hypothetical protein